jgi:hypothetical protein
MGPEESLTLSQKRTLHWANSTYLTSSQCVRISFNIIPLFMLNIPRRLFRWSLLSNMRATYISLLKPLDLMPLGLGNVTRDRYLCTDNSVYNDQFYTRLQTLRK